MKPVMTVPALASMLSPICLIRSPGGMTLMPHPNGVSAWSQIAIRENEFHFWNAGGASSAPLTHSRRTSGRCRLTCTIRIPVNVASRSVVTSATRRDLVGPESVAKHRAPRLAIVATTNTAVGPSVISSARISSRQPRAAPARSAA